MTSPDFTAADLRRGEALFKGPRTFVKGVVAIEVCLKTDATKWPSPGARMSANRA